MQEEQFDPFGDEAAAARREERVKKRLRRSAVRMAVALVLLGAVLGCKAAYPEQTKATFAKIFGGGLDCTELLGRLSVQAKTVMGKEKDPLPSPTAVPTPAEAPTESPTPTETPTATPPESATAQTAVPSIGASALLMSESFFQPNLTLDIDETYPIPFGTQKPEKVDFTVYPLPFEVSKPTEGVQTSAFGYRVHPVFGDLRFHYGIDFRAAVGDPIHAYADGVVEATGEGETMGKYIILAHKGNFKTVYAHCSDWVARDGQTVKRGAVIAKAGSTGLSTGPHLHFELHLGEKILNPGSYAPFADAG